MNNKIKTQKLMNDLVAWLSKASNQPEMARFTTLHLADKGYTNEEIDEIYQKFYILNALNKSEQEEHEPFVLDYSIRVLDGYESYYLHAEVISVLYRLNAEKIINNFMLDELVEILVHESSMKEESLSLDEAKGIIATVLFKEAQEIIFDLNEKINISNDFNSYLN